MRKKRHTFSQSSASDAELIALARRLMNEPVGPWEGMHPEADGVARARSPRQKHRYNAVLVTNLGTEQTQIQEISLSITISLSLARAQTRSLALSLARSLALARSSSSVCE
jgi:hypothetical protein